MKAVSELLKKHDGTLWHVTPAMTVFEAVEQLARLEVGALLVMDGDRLAGVFSERDYTRKITLLGRNSRETLVSEIMTANVITVNATTRTRECMSLMSARKIRHLPVVEGERVLGMISIRDIMDDIISDHEHTIASLESYIQS
ncbi:MAG: CBS domain-containing protein [Gemmatimonas sp.]|jgi:CBS domain-containing protein|uniref:CBS domain-containing protein n=1 Tax=Gemmatimonas sp. TaxID=1962908 RepID=UPI0031C06114|nr:CBS domain-containing protein [Gemmatimonas sp.]